MNSRILMVFGKLMIKLKSVIGIGRFEIMGGGGGGGEGGESWGQTFSWLETDRASPPIHPTSTSIVEHLELYKVISYNLGTFTVQFIYEKMYIVS